MNCEGNMWKIVLWVSLFLYSMLDIVWKINFFHVFGIGDGSKDLNGDLEYERKVFDWYDYLYFNFICVVFVAWEFIDLKIRHIASIYYIIPCFFSCSRENMLCLFLISITSPYFRENIWMTDNKSTYHLLVRKKLIPQNPSGSVWCVVEWSYMCVCLCWVQESGEVGNGEVQEVESEVSSRAMSM